MTGSQFLDRRRWLHWTQADAAIALGVTIAQISAIENGRSRVTKTIERLLDFHRSGDNLTRSPQEIRSDAEQTAAAAAVNADHWKARLEAGRG